MIARLENWAETDETGLGFDSSTCFKLLNGAERSPDGAWIKLERWEPLTLEQRRKFPPLAADFVVELRFPSDDLEELQAKMQEYMTNGVRLGWLIGPQNQRVEIYCLGQAIEIFESPSCFSGEDVLPNFLLELNRIL